MDLFFGNVNIADVLTGAVYKGNIAVKGGRIVGIGDVSPEKGMKVIDCEGMYAAPGLINLHVHLFGTGRPAKALGGGKAQERLVRLVRTPVGKAVLYKIMESNAETELKSGVTTIRTVGDFSGVDFKLKRNVEKGRSRARGLRMLVSGHAITVAGGHGAGTFALTGNTSEELEKLVDDAVREGADLIKICITGGVMDAKRRGAPGEVRMELPFVKAVCDRAHSYGKKVASHVQSSLGAEIAVRGGVDTIEHGAPIEGGTAEIFGSRGGAVVVTYSPAIPNALLGAEATKLDETAKFNSEVVMNGMTECAKSAPAYGIKIGLGTDASCPFCTQSGMWRELVYYSKRVGVTPGEAVRTATLGNAEILGIADETGSISVGKSADIVILKENPLKDPRAYSEIEYISARGRLLVKPKPSKMPDIEALLDKITEEL